MMTESPINSSNDLMRSIASAMDALLAFWREDSPTAGKEAVIFAEEFGLTAKDMNRSFIIPSRSGNHRNLNLSGDTPKFAKSLYPIWKAITEYKSGSPANFRGRLPKDFA